MPKLFAIAYLLAGPTLAGILVIAALTLGRFDAATVGFAALAGAVLALPVSYVLAIRLEKAIRPS